MPKHLRILFRLLPSLLLLTILAAACQSPPTLSPTPLSDTPIPPTSVPTQTMPPPSASGVVISEVLAGVQGNNNFEFIELYNAGDRVVDLHRWKLTYRLPTGDKDLPVYQWAETSLIPPHGHFLLARAGQDLGLLPDAEFEQALNTFGGSLILRQPDQQIADLLGWGNAPAEFAEGAVAPALQNDLSLERAPGGEAGNAADSDDNAADFHLNDTPNPQNCGSPVTPLGEKGLAIRLSAPASVQPGTRFDYTLEVTNQAAQPLHGVTIEMPIPKGLEVAQPSAGATLEAGILTWELDQLEGGESHSLVIPIQVPWSYFTAQVRNYFAQAEDWNGMAFGESIQTRVEGGLIPIGTARTLMDAELTVEGIATMYTGGYYAGGGNTKFYIADDTGGLQVQVFGGEGSVIVPLGARVQVRGTIGAYRGSMQIVPNLVPDDVRIVAPAGADTLWPPLEVSVRQAANDLESLPGQLAQVIGIVTRVEEFTYSYEIDLADDEGYVLTLYVDKLTNISVDGIRAGQIYRAVGILEVRDGTVKMYPRVQEDLTEVFPPVLMVVAAAPNTVLPGDVFTATLTVFNHTLTPLNEVVISASRPVGAAGVDSVLDGGSATDGAITWRVPRLEGEGGNVSVRYRLRATGQAGQIVIANYSAVAAEWAEAASGSARYIFIGGSVPIWAIQGDGFSSPYVLDHLTTKGIVIGAFPSGGDLAAPGLGGFWIQETPADDNPLTSEGLFIQTSGFAPDVALGDLVEVNGLVREPSQQTTLVVGDPADLTRLGSGNPLPAAVELDPPEEAVASRAYLEALEGMLVQVTGPAVAVSPTTKYGEYVVVLASRQVARLWQGAENGFAIMVDDGSSAVHADRSTLPYVVESGDQLSHLVGPLAYTYGRYKIEPLTVPEIQSNADPLPSLPVTAADEFSVMTWNVENLFDVLDPHPSDPPRPRLADYKLHLTKVANTILAAGAPTIVGLQEIENIGILEDLAAHELLADYPYQPVLIEGHDSRGIDVGYLIRGDRAKVLKVEQHDAPEGLTSRPPLLVQIEVNTDGGSARLYVINNHFTSMSGGELATEPRRIAQAAWNVSIVEGVRAVEPDAYLAVIGDLNSYINSPPIDTLRQAGLHPVFDVRPEGGGAGCYPVPCYTYIYQGESQTLDYILVTPSLLTLLRRVEVLHVNADFPPITPGDTSPEHKSDHDPVVATFSMGG